MEACLPCNPGQQLVNGSCAFCPLRQYSDGVSPCSMCPGSSAPQTTVVYQFWDNLPDNANLSSFCLSGHGQFRPSSSSSSISSSWPLLTSTITQPHSQINTNIRFCSQIHNGLAFYVPNYNHQDLLIVSSLLLIFCFMFF